MNRRATRALLLVGAAFVGACSVVLRYHDEAAPPGAGAGSGGKGGGGGAQTASASSTSVAPASASTGAVMCGGTTPDLCGGTCVNLQADPHNCKTCGTECAAPTVCELGKCITPRTCRNLHAQHPELPSAVYTIDPDGDGNGAAAFMSYCEMVADGGGWTLLLKVSDSGAFSYYGEWTTPTPYHPEYPDLDMQEAKLPGCFNVSTDHLRVGMKANGDSVIRWITLPYSTTGLCPWFMAEKPNGTIIGLAKWRQLLATPSTGAVLCGEGLDLGPGIVRLGVLTADKIENCNYPQAVLGFGISPAWYPGAYTGCTVKCCADNGNVNTAAFGYIMGR